MFDGAKPRFLNRGKKRRSELALSAVEGSDRGAEWVDSKRDDEYSKDEMEDPLCGL